MRSPLSHLKQTILSGALPMAVSGAVLAVLLSLPLNSLPAADSDAPVPRVVLIGGGPEAKHNQAGIESNIRYVSRLLPTNAPQTVLFADGNPKSATVLYEANPNHHEGYTLGEHAFDLIFDTDSSGSLKYRPPKIARIDGPSQRASLKAVFDRLHTQLSSSLQPLFLYFTGHGSPSAEPDPDSANSSYDLWGNGLPLTVKQLSRELDKIPSNVPVTLVMVQCFSGGFGNLLFDGGSPQGPPTDRDFAGFFAATPDRMSAGCTPSTDESSYQDFTSYFFSALSGSDRVGHPISLNVDYNHDGRVGMNEAYAYSLIADDSIDVPTCTSDVFLRRFVKSNENEVMETPFTQLLAWATPAQKAALDALSAKLGLSGENRLSTGYKNMKTAYDRFQKDATDKAQADFDQLQKSLRDQLAAKWPALLQPNASNFAAARTEAIRYLNAQAKAGRLNRLFEADETLGAGDEGPGYTSQQTRLLRFIRLGKSVVLAHRLATDGDPKLLARWKRLQAAEGRTPFIPASVAKQRSANRLADRQSHS